MWRKLLALSAADRRLLLEAGRRLLAARATAALAPRRAMGAAPPATAARDGLAAPATGPAPDPVTMDRVAWAVRAVARRLPAGFRGCLPQAMATHAMLRRRGAPARLVIGVRRTPASGPLEAHAWVESGGRVIVGWLEDLSSYVPLAAAAPVAFPGAAWR